MERLYSLCLCAGLRPDEFWRSTLGEVLCYLHYCQQKERAEWSRMSQLMALTYNINRGKGKPLSAEDFNPYDSELQHAKATEMTPELRDHFASMSVILNNGTE